MTIKSLKHDGVFWLRDALTAEDIALLSQCFKQTAPGKRLGAPAELLAALSLRSALRSALPGFVAVRAVAFDKSAKSNWSLPWHQDRVIAVSERAEVAGYRNWTKKNGVWHCEPPIEFLRAMVFLRIHLDPSNEENGAMEIAPGSHQAGLVGTNDAEAVARAYSPVIPKAAAGDVLALPMLTLHRSRPSPAQSKRRVIRLDMACQSLPPPLRWAG